VAAAAAAVVEWSLVKYNNQPTETEYKWGKRNRCKIMNGGQESGFDDILMNGHTQKFTKDGVSPSRRRS
jgi:hypothetical protein